MLRLNMRLRTCHLLIIILILSENILQLNKRLLVNSQCPLECTCLSVIGTDCINLSLNGIPRGFSAGTENLNISFNNIVSLEGNSLNLLTSLRYLNLSHNSIRTIHPEAFMTIGNLQILDLSYNKIVHLNPQTFIYNRHLTWVCLSMNEMFEFTEEDSLYLPNLLVLYLSHCGIQHVPPDAFQNFQDLEELHLNNNNISSLYSDVFLSLSQLKLLNFSGNNFSRLDYKLFVPLFSLKHLDFSKNAISNIDTRFLKSVSRVEKLVLDDNPWRCACSLYEAYDFCAREENCTLDLTCRMPERFDGLSWSFVEKLGCLEYDNVTLISIGSDVTFRKVEEVTKEVGTAVEQGDYQADWYVATMVLLGVFLVGLILIIVLTIMHCRSGREKPQIMDEHSDAGFESISLGDFSS